MLRPVTRWKTTFLCVAIAIGSVTILGCSKHNGKQDYVAEAVQYRMKGDDRAAVIELKNALQKNPDNGDARYLLATIYNEQGRGDLAAIELRKASQLGFDPNKIKAALGQAMVLQGEYHKALDETKPAGKGKVAAAIDTARGDAYLGLRKIEEAASAFREALKQDKDYSRAYLGLAQVAASKGDDDEALRQTDMALAKSPKDILGLMVKGELLRRQKHYDAARAVYEQVTKLRRHNVAARLALISLDLESNDLKKARTRLEATKKIAPKNLMVRYMEGLLDFRQNRFDQAQDALLDVLREHNNYMPAILFSGATAYALGSYEQANQYLARYLTRFPKDTYALKLQAANKLQLHQPKDALQLIRPLLAKSPKDPQALALVGQAYLQQKDYRKATDYLEKAVAAEPTEAPLRTQLALSRLASGNTHQAIADLESAAKLDPHEFRADALLVVTYLRNGAYDKAVTAAKAWQKTQPHNPVAYNMAGMAYVAMNDLPSAEKSFAHALSVKTNFFPAASNLARIALKQHNPEQAKLHLKTFLKNNPGDVRAMIALSNLAAERGDDKSRVRWLEQAIQAHPKAMEPQRLLVTYYVTSGQMQKALVAAANAQATSPYSQFALALLGDTQLAAGKSKEAVASFRKLVKLAPHSPISYYKLATAQTAIHDLASAQQSLEKALSLRPDYLKAETALVVVQLRAGHYAKSLEAARQIQQRHPNSPVGLSLEGDILMERKQYSGALKAYESAFKIRSNTALALKIQHALRAGGQVATADRKASQWLEAHHNDVEMRTYLAATYLQRGQNSQAMAQYRYILHVEPKNITALNNLAVLTEQQNGSQALHYAHQAHELAPNNPATQDTLGWILVGRGEIARGLALLRNAAKGDPLNSSIQYHYGAALAKAGKRADARRVLEKLIASNHHFPDLEKVKTLLSEL